MKYYTTLILFLLNIAFFSCKEETLNDGNIKILLKNKMPYVTRIESELSSLSPIDDEILSGLFSKGYEPFLKAAETHVFNNIEHSDHFKIAEEMMKLCQIENYIPYLLANAMDDNLYATSFYGIFTDPQTNKSKFIVVIGQKKDIVSTTSDWILIAFKEEFDFYKGYSSCGKQSEIVFAGDCFHTYREEQNGLEFYEYCIPYGKHAFSVFWEK